MVTARLAVYAVGTRTARMAFDVSKCALPRGAGAVNSDLFATLDVAHAAATEHGASMTDVDRISGLFRRKSAAY
jgi:hypothetical protein